jgi:hypothetical protein
MTERDLQITNQITQITQITRATCETNHVIFASSKEAKNHAFDRAAVTAQITARLPTQGRTDG